MTAAPTVAATRVIELGQPFAVDMPRLPAHGPFEQRLTKRHGEDMRQGGASGAIDRICVETHCGTHVDSVFHVSRDLRLFGGADAREAQADGRGIFVEGRRNLWPIVGRGVLVDVPSLLDVDVLPEDYAITPEVTRDALARDGLDVAPGDVVLFRTGWARYWDEPGRYVTKRSPGPTAETARWLASRRVQATGSDTAPFELFPSPALEAHVVLLVEAGIPIMENLDLEQLAKERIAAFEFVALPLAIEGATGSPISPVALVSSSGKEQHQ